MKPLKLWRSLLTAIASIGLIGCATDAPTAPRTSSEANPALVADLLEGTGLVTKDALTRKNPLAKDITVSAVIGKEGGSLSIPEAGFYLTIPSGAVREPTEFVVTALQGKLVAYEFGPHGITFSRAIFARQDLSLTDWRLLPFKPLTAGYFADIADLNTATKTVLLSEVISGTTAPLTKQFTWPIEHFSGYVVAW